MDTSEAESLLMRLQIATTTLTHAANHGTKQAGYNGRRTSTADLELERVVKKLYKGLTGEAPSDEAITRITRW